MAYKFQIGDQTVYVGINPLGTDVAIIRNGSNGFLDGTDCAQGLEGKVEIRDMAQETFDKIYVAGMKVRALRKDLASETTTLNNTLK